MTIRVVALGGSLLRPEESERGAWINGVASLVSSLTDDGDKFGIVVGGGAPAREAIALASGSVSDTALLDGVGIAATRLNAEIVRVSLAERGVDVFPNIPSTVEQASAALASNRAVVMGGTVPGHTTDAVAIRLAIDVGAARCYIATNVDRVHSSDPREDPEAQPLDSITLERLVEIVGPAEHSTAGASAVIDPIGVGEALAAGMPLAVLDGRRLDRLTAALTDEPFEGTTIEVSN